MIIWKNPSSSFILFAVSACVFFTGASFAFAVNSTQNMALLAISILIGFITWIFYKFANHVIVVKNRDRLFWWFWDICFLGLFTMDHIIVERVTLFQHFCIVIVFICTIIEYHSMTRGGAK